MTLRNLVTSDFQSVILNTDDFAVVVTRYPAGDRSAGVSVTGIFDEDEPAKDKSRGIENVRRASLLVPSSTEVLQDDKYQISGEIWQVESFGEPDLAFKEINLIRRKEHRRTTKAI